MAKVDLKKIFLNPIVITFLIFSTFILIKLYQYGWNPSGFIHIGDLFGDKSLLSPKTMMPANSVGYDGQFYYRMSLDPFSIRKTDYGITFDYARYRYQRILYPIMSWGLSLGNKSLIPIDMIVVNLTFLLFLAHISGQLAKIYGISEYYGIILPLYSGFFISLSHNLTEIVEITLMVFSYYLLVRGKNLWAAVFLSLSILTKETALLAAFGYLIAFIWERRKNWYYFLLPILVYFSWQLLLNYLWASQLNDAVSSNISFPFIGLVENFINSIDFEYYKDYWFYIDLSILVIFVFLIIRNIKNNLTLAPIKLGWLLYGLLVICTSEKIWIENTNYLRVMSEFYIFGFLILFGRKTQIIQSIISIACFIWLPFAFYLVLINK